jgi:outer membrane receptor protein involved in Fe transport
MPTAPAATPKPESPVATPKPESAEATPQPGAPQPATTPSESGQAAATPEAPQQAASATPKRATPRPTRRRTRKPTPKRTPRRAASKKGTAKPTAKGSKPSAQATEPATGLPLATPTEEPRAYIITPLPSGGSSRATPQAVEATPQRATPEVPAGGATPLATPSEPKPRGGLPTPWDEKRRRRETPRPTLPAAVEATPQLPPPAAEPTQAPTPQPTPEATEPVTTMPPGMPTPEAPAAVITPLSTPASPSPEATPRAAEAVPQAGTPEATAYVITPLATPSGLTPRPGLPTPWEGKEKPEQAASPEPTALPSQPATPEAAQPPTPVPTQPTAPVPTQPTAPVPTTPSPEATAEASPSATPTAQESPAPVRAGGPADALSSVAILSGDELRRQGAVTVADALQDVVGLDAASGSDRGPFVPNVGVRGVKELQSLLVTINGVPAGGAFDPSLTQIFLDDVDRIEIVRGPQGTLFGMRAYNGVIRIFTRVRQDGQLAGRLGGGSFKDFHGSAGWVRSFSQATELRLSVSGQKTDGWQKRTGRSSIGGSLALEHRLGEDGNVRAFFQGYSDKQDWGSPLPYANGALLSGFALDQNVAPGGSEEKHQLLALGVDFSYRLASWLRMENTLGLASDKQRSMHSSVVRISRTGEVATVAGVFLEPEQTRLFDDLRFVADVELLGPHRISAGAALTTGTAKTDGGRPFSFRFDIGPDPQIPDFATLPLGDPVALEDRRTLAGFYVYDEWTPVERLTIAGGGRFNVTSDKLLVRTDTERTDDRSFHGGTGDVTVLVRALKDGAGSLQSLNLYASARHNFSQPVVDLAALDAATVVKPEWIDMQEGGVRTRWLNGELAADLGGFHSELGNRVQASVDEHGDLVLANGAKESVVGGELELQWTPQSLRGFALSGGLSIQDAKFKKGTFLTPEGDVIDVKDKQPAMVPKTLWDLKLEYAPDRGFGGFAAARGQDKRPFDPTNAAFAKGFAEFDLGLWYQIDWGRLAVVGRNLGDDRHVTTGSSLGSDQFYVAPARQVTVQLDLHLR